MRIALVSLFLLGLLVPAFADDFKREGTGPARQAKDSLEGKAPPPFEVQNWMNTDGKELKWEDLKGKVIVIDFWGVWCPPCRTAIPHLKDLYTKHKNEGLVIIGIHTTNQGDKMAAYVAQEKIPYPLAVDVNGATVKAFKVDSYPDYYLIDRAGRLRVADLANADLDRAIGILLREKTP